MNFPRLSAGPPDDDRPVVSEKTHQEIEAQLMKMLFEKKTISRESVFENDLQESSIKSFFQQALPEYADLPIEDLEEIFESFKFSTTYKEQDDELAAQVEAKKEVNKRQLKDAFLAFQAKKQSQGVEAAILEHKSKYEKKPNVPKSINQLPTSSGESQLGTYQGRTPDLKERMGRDGESKRQKVYNGSSETVGAPLTKKRKQDPELSLIDSTESVIDVEGMDLSFAAIGLSSDKHHSAGFGCTRQEYGRKLEKPSIAGSGGSEVGLLEMSADNKIRKQLNPYKDISSAKLDVHSGASGEEYPIWTPEFNGRRTRSLRGDPLLQLLNRKPDSKGNMDEVMCKRTSATCPGDSMRMGTPLIYKTSIAAPSDPQEPSAPAKCPGSMSGNRPISAFKNRPSRIMVGFSSSSDEDFEPSGRAPGRQFGMNGHGLSGGHAGRSLKRKVDSEGSIEEVMSKRTRNNSQIRPFDRRIDSEGNVDDEINDQGLLQQRARADPLKHDLKRKLDSEGNADDGVNIQSPFQKRTRMSE
jgi:hypothetical protein